jgi:hypothetical protein
MKTTEAPKPTSSRKRPNKTFIQQMAEFRGHMTGAEKTQLAGLEVKNALQRVNNRAMCEDENIVFGSAENTELQKLMKYFVKRVNAILKEK